MLNWKHLALISGVTCVLFGCDNHSKSDKPPINFSVCTENHDGKQCLYNQKKGCTNKIYQQLLVEIKSLPANVYRCPADVIEKSTLADQDKSDIMSNVVESSVSSQTERGPGLTVVNSELNKSAKDWLRKVRDLSGFTQCVHLQPDAEAGFCVRFANPRCQPSMLSSLFDKNNYDPTRFVPLPCGDEFSPGRGILYTQNEIQLIEILQGIEQKLKKWDSQISNLNNKLIEKKEGFRVGSLQKEELDGFNDGLEKPYQHLTNTIAPFISSPRAMMRFIKNKQQTMSRERSLLNDQSSLLVQASDYFLQKQEYEQKKRSGGASSDELNQLFNRLKKTASTLISLSRKIDSDRKSFRSRQENPVENGYATLKNAKNCLNKSQDGRVCLSSINQFCSDDHRKALIFELTSRQLPIPPLCYPPQSFVKEHPDVRYCWDSSNQCLQYENAECKPEAVTLLRLWMNKNNQNLNFCHALKSIKAGRQKGAWPKNELSFVNDLTDLLQNMIKLEESKSLEQRDGIINQCLIKADAILKQIASVSKTDANKRDMAYFKHSASQLKNFLQSCKDSSDVKCHA